MTQLFRICSCKMNLEVFVARVVIVWNRNQIQTFCPKSIFLRKTFYYLRNEYMNSIFKIGAVEFKNASLLQNVTFLFFAQEQCLCAYVKVTWDVNTYCISAKHPWPYAVQSSLSAEGTIYPHIQRYNATELNRRKIDGKFATRFIIYTRLSKHLNYCYVCVSEK